MSALTRTAPLWLALGLAGSVAACQGQILEPGANGTATPGEARDDAGGDSLGNLRFEQTRKPGEGGTKLDRSQACNPDDPGISPLRRLSHQEYRNTVSDLFPEARIPEVQLVPDLPIHGFENNSRALNPSPKLVEQYSSAAAEVAAAVMGNTAARDAIVTCDPAVAADACGGEIVEELGQRIFRRPLTDAERQRFGAFLDTQLESFSFEGALELTLSAMLQSPAFIYRLELGQTASGDASVPLTDWELATRLSYFLWQSLPDAELRAAAASGSLSTPAELERQARRMLDDPRAARAFGEFVRQWLHLDKLLEKSKNPAQFPLWNARLREELAEESERFIALLAENDELTLKELLTSRKAVVSPAVAELYGVEVPTEGWQEVELPAGERAGILTRGAFLAALARPTNGSPPLRGVAVLEHLLCAPPPAPPPEVDTSISPQDAGEDPLTNRQLFESKTSQPACEGCHVAIDGIGMAFEHFDAVGSHRTTDNGFAVDASGQLTGTDVDQQYEDAIGLSEILAESEQVKKCVTVNWYRYAFGRDEQPGDWCKVDELHEQFVSSGGDIKALALAIITSPEFARRTPVQ